MVNYLIFAGKVYSKEIKLPTILAIEPEPKTPQLFMEPATVSEVRQQTKHYCCQLKVLYKICVHFCHVYGPTSPDFHRIIRLQNWLSASWQYLLYINIKITIYTYCYDNDVCYMQTNVCVMYI